MTDQADDPMQGLNPRQRTFVELLPFHNWSIASAGLAAGYSKWYCDSRLQQQVKKDVRLCTAIERKRQSALPQTRGIAWAAAQCVKRFEHCTKSKESTNTEVSAAIDEPSARQYLDMYMRHLGAYEADNRQREVTIGMVIL
jgi:hypothetical protein